ncbi:uncharacterized protein LOC127577878 isoform X2 [Pristis pectinata]|uniref:uncharacterized protein LOC127577878 isoform X2 n=1 Tax=Pristis pectinata TaxID=685728 RepID=UPI00223E6567|nr:uncharacterized protein LOC127577878 isoform X2 [Pristis pectinata]
MLTRFTLADSLRLLIFFFLICLQSVCNYVYSGRQLLPSRLYGAGFPLCWIGDGSSAWLGHHPPRDCTPDHGGLSFARLIIASWVGARTSWITVWLSASLERQEACTHWANTSSTLRLKGSVNSTVIFTVEEQGTQLAFCWHCSCIQTDINMTPHQRFGKTSKGWPTTGRDESASYAYS